jgi:hypothetical protein
MAHYTMAVSILYIVQIQYTILRHTYHILYSTRLLYNAHILYIVMGSKLQEATLYFYTLHPPLP